MKKIDDFADASMYVLVRGLQLGFLLLGVGVFVGQLIWGA